MIDSCAEKVVHVVSTAVMEDRIIKAIKDAGCNGYTVFDVRGDGEAGLQDGHSEGETNIMFMIVVSKDIYESLLDKLYVYMKKGHHMMVTSSDVDVMTPSKFDKKC